MRCASEAAMMLALRKFLFLLVVFVVKIWLVKALFLRIFPVPVLLNLLAAPRFVFIFGISYSTDSLLGTVASVLDSSVLSSSTAFSNTGFGAFV